jgi:broad specificity phosphatase PhoE
VRRLILARHAQSELNLQNVLNGDASVEVRLTPLGREQARALGREAGPVDLVAHTSFGRTRETAELAWPQTSKLLVPELDEISFGRYEGTQWSDGYHEWARTTSPLEECPGGGESRATAARRFVRGYRRLLDRAEDTIALVGHGAHIRYLLLALEGSPPVRVLEGVPPAVPYTIPVEDVARGVDLIAAWAEEPAWH